MKAIVYTEYGSPDVLQFKDAEKPVPADDEVLIKVHAASVNAADLHEAIRYLEQGHAQGKVVITVAENTSPNNPFDVGAILNAEKMIQ
jgi:D-arabinose 1-dehydrogenase-like Zn-dependent alcohol dehydrogenase